MRASHEPVLARIRNSCQQVTVSKYIPSLQYILDQLHEKLHLLNGPNPTTMPRKLGLHTVPISPRIVQGLTVKYITPGLANPTF